MLNVKFKKLSIYPSIIQLEPDKFIFTSRQLQRHGFLSAERIRDSLAG